MSERPAVPRSVRGRLTVLGALSVLRAGLILLQAGALADVLADTVGGADPRTGAVRLVLAVSARAVVGWLEAAVADGAGAAVKAELRGRILAGLRARGPRWLGGQRTGELVTLARRGVEAVDPYYGHYFPAFFAAVTVPCAILLRLAFLDTASLLVVLLTLPLIPVFGALVGRCTAERTRRQWSAISVLGGHFLDSLRGLPTLRLFGRTARQRRLLADRAEDCRAATMSTLRVAFLSALVLDLVASLSVALIAVPIGLRLLTGEMVLPSALLVLVLAPEAYLPLRALGSMFHLTTDGRDAAARVAELAGDDTGTPVGTRPVPAAFGEIRFERVTVLGRGGRPVLDEVSFTVREGEHVVLVGPSGAGKSTIFDLLLGFVRPDSGRVLVGGVDLCELDPGGWRESLTWVPQRPWLFAGTVTANVALGEDEASPAEIRAAGEAAGLAAFVPALPGGYAARVGEGGLGLSSGERQRIALARALLRSRRRSSRVLLFDEPTARLDNGTERAVLDGVATLMAGRTALVVAHRPALAALADRVLVVSEGRVVEKTGLRWEAMA